MLGNIYWLTKLLIIDVDPVRDAVNAESEKLQELEQATTIELQGK